MGLLTDLMPGMKAVLRCCLLSKVGFDTLEPKAGIVLRGLTKINEKRNMKP